MFYVWSLLNSIFLAQYFLFRLLAFKQFRNNNGNYGKSVSQFFRCGFLCSFNVFVWKSRWKRGMFIFYTGSILILIYSLDSTDNFVFKKVRAKGEICKNLSIVERLVFGVELGNQAIKQRAAKVNDKQK